MGPFTLAGIESVAIGKDEKAFFAQLGARIAQLRKEQGITQVQLAEWLNVSQQTVNAYEVGRRRMAGARSHARAREARWAHRHRF